ncbi:hypothetical protein H9P43_001420 [Blastocladiella emersonii ATCC 22665]|nr:hypothetical protein H9P43_001420 [Blastocladiella emersonii ATCC 22665]
MATENYQARALYAVGHFDKLKAMWTASPDDAELYFLHARAVVSQGHAQLATSHPATAPLELLTARGAPSSEFAALRVVADFLAAGGSKNPDALNAANEAIQALIADPVRGANPRVRVVVGEYLLATNQLDAVVATVGLLAKEHNVDAASILLQTFLEIDRVDLAELLAADVGRWAEDAIQAQVLEARAGMAAGNKVQDALWAWEELVQTYAASPFLLCMMGTCHLLQNNLVEAARLLNEAIAMDPAYADAHVNLVVAAAAAGKADLNQVSALWASFPSHPFTENLALKAGAFDRAAAKFS